MPIANCLPFLDSSATKKCFHPNVSEGQTTDPESFVQSEHLDWNRPTAISLDVTVEFFLNTQDRLEELYQQWHTVAYVRQCSSFFTGFYVWTCINPKGWEYLGSQNMLDRHFGWCSYIQILQKCIMILQFANFSRPGQCWIEMRTFRIKVLCLLQTTLLQSYINHADRNQKHARQIPS